MGLANNNNGLFLSNDRKILLEELNELFEDTILVLLSQDIIEQELKDFNNILRKFHSKMLLLEQDNI